MRIMSCGPLRLFFFHSDEEFREVLLCVRALKEVDLAFLKDPVVDLFSPGSEKIGVSSPSIKPFSGGKGDAKGSIIKSFSIPLGLGLQCNQGHFSTPNPSFGAQSSSGENHSL